MMSWRTLLRQSSTPLLLPLLMLLLLLVTCCAGLPQGSSGDGDLAAANAALSARLLHSAGASTAGGRKRHVTRPHARPPSVGDPAAALKVIRRRKVLAPRETRGDVSDDDVTAATERTFRQSLRPPFLALLNESHFSEQPEFVLAQAAEHRMEPFRGFGEKLESPGQPSRPRDFRTVPRSSVSAAVRVNATAEDSPTSELSERHGKVIVRRKKVRVLSAADTDEASDEPRGAATVPASEKPGVMINSTEIEEPRKAAPIEADNPKVAEATTRPTEATTKASVSATTPASAMKVNVTAVGPRRIASKRRPGRLLVPLPKTTHSSSTEKPKPTLQTPLRRKSAAPNTRRPSNATTESPPRRSGSRAAPLKPRRRPPGSDRTPAPRTPKPPTSSPRTPARAAVTSPPARRRISALAQRRRERFRSRVSRLRPNATTAGASTTEAAPVNREKKEVAKVLGLLGKIRNRARTRPSFLPTRSTDKAEGSSEAPVTAVPSSTPSTKVKLSTTTTTTTTTSTTTTTVTTTRSTTTTTTTSTTTKRTTTATPAEPSTQKVTAASPVTPRASATTTERTTPTTTRSPDGRKASSPSPINAGTAPAVSTTTAASKAARVLPSPSTPAAVSVLVERRQRPDTLRRTPLPSSGDKPNLLARRLQERRHTFSLRGGPKAGRRPLLPPTIPPFPLLLSTIKSAQQRGLLGRNVTISVSFPRGAAGPPRSRPALPDGRQAFPVGRPTLPPTRSTAVTTKPTPLPSAVSLTGSSEAPSENPEAGESAGSIRADGTGNETNDSGDSGRDRVGEEIGRDVQRTVLGTSLETSVSVAVSPLEFRLRKRVKLPPRVGEGPIVSGDRLAGDEETPQTSVQQVRPEEQSNPESTTSSPKDEVLEGKSVPVTENKGSSVTKETGRAGKVPLTESRGRSPVLESSVMETTESPLPVSDGYSSSPSATELGDSEGLPLSITKDRKEALLTPDRSAPEPVNINADNSDTTGLSTNHDGDGSHAAEDHSYLQDFLVNSDDAVSSEWPANRPDSASRDSERSSSRSPAEGDFMYFSDTEFGTEAVDADYDGGDLTAAPSTTMATFIRPTESEMQRILAAENSAAPSSNPSALAPVIHYASPSEHHSPSDPAFSGEPSSTSSSPSATSYSTSSSASSSTPRSSSTTPRQARVLEVDVAQPVSPGPGEPSTAGGPIYLVSLLFVLPVVAVLLWYLKKNHPDVQQLLPERLKSMLAHETSDSAQENFYPVEVEETAGKASTSHAHDTLARRRRWEHPRDTLRLQSVLGEGHFGQVWRAEVDNIGGHQGTLLVAVKSAKESAAAKEHQDLLRELRIMQDLGGHPNVVTLLGCCTAEEPVLVIMEYMVFGKLLTYLRENRGRHNYYNFSHDSAVLTSPDLTLFACQIAAGMEYIAGKGIIHRDLAARNILVDHTKVCKVSDFGMSRSVKEISTEVFEQKHRGALPIRWMSPESLYHNTFNPPTDCWSFGILLWEIITLGSTPYPGLSAREVMRSVREGYRLERPDHCHPQLYQLASSCWAPEPSWRPTFSELRNDLEVLLEDQNQGYVDLDRFQEEIYSTLNKSSDEKV